MRTIAIALLPCSAAVAAVDWTTAASAGSCCCPHWPRAPPLDAARVPDWARPTASTDATTWSVRSQLPFSAAPSRQTSQVVLTDLPAWQAAPAMAAVAAAAVRKDMAVGASCTEAAVRRRARSRAAAAHIAAPARTSSAVAADRTSAERRVEARRAVEARRSPAAVVRSPRGMARSRRACRRAAVVDSLFLSAHCHTDDHSPYACGGP